MPSECRDGSPAPASCRIRGRSPEYEGHGRRGPREPRRSRPLRIRYPAGWSGARVSPRRCPSAPGTGPRSCGDRNTGGTCRWRFRCTEARRGRPAPSPCRRRSRCNTPRSRAPSAPGEARDSARHGRPYRRRSERFSSSSILPLYVVYWTQTAGRGTFPQAECPDCVCIMAYCV